MSEALALEPDCAFAHLCGLTVSLAARDFAAVGRSLELLVTERGVPFDDLADPSDADWKAFLQAPESAAWRKPGNQ